MLFLIIHQTFELWFKQVLYELRAVVAMFQQPVLRETESTRVLHHLGRVCEILKVRRAVSRVCAPNVWLTRAHYASC